MNRPAEELFHEARELPAAERAAYVLGACGRDAGLRSKVEALLEAESEAGGSIASPTEAEASHARGVPSAGRALEAPPASPR